jgi:hypothetical protein
MASKSENRIQIEFMNYCRWMAKFHDERFALVHHVANGGLRSKREAATFKLMGVVPGIPDVFVPMVSIESTTGKLEPVGDNFCGFTDYKIYHGLYIEFKTDRGSLSKEQKRIIPLLESQGYKVEICRSAEEAIQVVEEYLCEELPRRVSKDDNQ